MEPVFGFVLQGAADAFAIPPHEPWRLTDMSEDFRLLQVTTQLA